MNRPRTRSRPKVAELRVHPIGTPPAGSPPNTGPLASAAWLVALELLPTVPRWFVELVYDAPEHDTQFQLEIFAEEWGYRFRHAGKTSWIRVTDIPFAHGQDDHGLLRETPKLRDIGRLLRKLETRFGIELANRVPAISTNIEGGEPVILAWARDLEAR